MTFYFALVEKAESVWGPEHKRNDEEVFSLRIRHSEGEFPSAEVEIINPRVGLLTSTRNQWVWIALDDTPLFFGRMVGVPQDLTEEIIRCTFVARPRDYEFQRQALADSLRVAPWYSPVWLSEEEQVDPDAVLEGRSALWHIDRVTHELTISDVIQGEDGVELFTGADAFYDSVRLTHGQSPLRRVHVEASVEWDQVGAGAIDITRPLLLAFKAGTPANLLNIDNTQATKNGMICVAGGDQLVERWPEAGRSFGGGWTVGVSSAQVVGEAPLPPIGIGDTEALGEIRDTLGNEVGVDAAKWRYYYDMFRRSPGFLTAVLNRPLTTFAGGAAGEYDIYWVPVWRIAPHLEVNWTAERERSEMVTFTVSADVQPLLSEADDEETETLGIGPVRVDGYLHDQRVNRFFNSDTGREAFENLLARARALLLHRSRAVTVEFETTFDRGVELSCRKSATVVDDRLPGGQATGKVKSYQLSMDGQTGEAVAQVILGCTVGRDGEVEVVEGEPDYVELGYVAAGYQTTHDEVIVPLAGDLGYGGLDGYAIEDDGVNLFAVTRTAYLESLTVEGTLVDQEGVAVDVDGSLVQRRRAPEIGRPERWNNIAKVIEEINAVKTRVRVEMRPVTGGPFETIIEPTVTELKVPRTIDLEEAASG